MFFNRRSACFRNSNSEFKRTTDDTDELTNNPYYFRFGVHTKIHEKSLCYSGGRQIIENLRLMLISKFVYRFYFYNDFPKTNKISPVYLFERLAVIDYRKRFFPFIWNSGLFQFNFQGFLIYRLFGFVRSVREGLWLILYHGQTQTNTDESKDLEPKVRHNPLQRIMLFPRGPWLKSEFLFPEKEILKKMRK
jgi:hypothetical protein